MTDSQVLRQRAWLPVVRTWGLEKPFKCLGARANQAWPWRRCGRVWPNGGLHHLPQVRPVPPHLRHDPRQLLDRPCRADDDRRPQAGVDRSESCDSRRPAAFCFAPQASHRQPCPRKWPLWPQGGSVGLFLQRRFDPDGKGATHVRALHCHRERQYVHSLDGDRDALGVVLCGDGLALVQ